MATEDKISEDAKFYFAEALAINPKLYVGDFYKAAAEALFLLAKQEQLREIK